VVIPTLNEAAHLPLLLADLALAQGLVAELVVVDGGSSDGTAAIARLAGARAQGSGPGSGTSSDLAWWAEGLAVLETQLEGHHPPKERLQQLEALQSPQAPLQWAMDGATARSLLAAWQPWRLLVALSGSDGTLAEAVRGAALSLEADPGGVGAGPDPGAADLGAPVSASRDRLLRLRGQLQFEG
jgi:hypothetical protein